MFYCSLADIAGSSFYCVASVDIRGQHVNAYSGGQRLRVSNIAGCAAACEADTECRLFIFFTDNLCALKLSAIVGQGMWGVTGPNAYVSYACFQVK